MRRPHSGFLAQLRIDRAGERSIIFFDVKWVPVHIRSQWQSRSGGDIAQDSPAADFFSGPLRRYQRAENPAHIALHHELGPGCVVPGSYQIDQVAMTQHRGEQPRRWVVGRSRRYNVTKLGDALKSIGWVLRGEVQQKDGTAPLSLCLFERI